ncbi:MAG: hypothetical protein ABFC96_11885 [Thermoguttaceae bacterium]
MDSFRFCLALAPVAFYLLLLGAISLRRRPLLVSGVRDAAALAVAVAGLVIVGPIELLFPFEAAVRYGPYIWAWLLALYVMFVVLWLLVLRPRLVIYHFSADALRPVLAELAGRLDPSARWAGDSLALPSLGVQLYVDHFAASGSVSLCSAGGNQNRAGWRQLETSLRSALHREEVARSPLGLALIGVGLLCSAAIAWVIVQQPQTIVESVAAIIRTVLRMVGLGR